MTRKILIYVLFVIWVTWTLGSPNASARQFSEDEKLILVGIGAYSDGFYDIAEKEFSNFIRDYPKHEKLFDICYLFGKTLYIKGKLKEAKIIFSKRSEERRV